MGGWVGVGMVCGWVGGMCVSGWGWVGVGRDGVSCRIFAAVLSAGGIFIG